MTKTTNNTNPQPQTLTVPRRPVLKLPLPPSPWGPASSDLPVLVSEALKAHPSPRRTQPEFMMSSAHTGAPQAPPPTPVEGPRSAGSSRSAGTTCGTLTPRGSSEAKRVSFVEVWRDDEGGSGRTSGEVAREG